MTLTQGAIPELVSRALEGSLRSGWMDTTRNETGHLLQVLATASTGPIGEIGTGCGAGAAWLSAGARSGVEVFSVEMDERLVALTRELFRGTNVAIQHGSWSALSDHGPFALLYVSAHIAQEMHIDDVASMLSRGATLIIDEVPPSGEGNWDAPMGESLRSTWVSDPRFQTVSLSLGHDIGVLLAVKR